MYYIYNGEEFKYVQDARTGIIVNHELLKVYKPSVEFINVKDKSVTESMILSYVYTNLRGVKDSPLHYPLRVAENSITKDLVIQDSSGYTGYLLYVKHSELKKIKNINRIYLTLPIKLKILDSFMAGEYDHLLEMGIPQVSDMINRLIELNNNNVLGYIAEEEEDKTEDLVDILDRLSN